MRLEWESNPTTTHWPFEPVLRRPSYRDTQSRCIFDDRIIYSVLSFSNRSRNCCVHTQLSLISLLDQFFNTEHLHSGQRAQVITNANNIRAPARFQKLSDRIIKVCAVRYLYTSQIFATIADGVLL